MSNINHMHESADNSELDHLSFEGTDGKTYKVEKLNGKGTYVISLEAGVVKGQLKLHGGQYMLDSEHKGAFPQEAIDSIIAHLNSLLPMKKDQMITGNQKDIGEALSG